MVRVALRALRVTAPVCLVACIELCVPRGLRCGAWDDLLLCVCSRDMFPSGVTGSTLPPFLTGVIITGVAAASSGVGWWDPMGSPMHKGSSGFEPQASLSPRK